MGGINSLSGLNKVSVDFRPTITTIAQKPDSAAQPLPEAQVAPKDQPPVNANAKSVVRELDVLLLKAAKASTKSLDGDISVRKQNGRTKRIGGQVAMNVHLLDCPSYFTRDYFDKIFA